VSPIQPHQQVGHQPTIQPPRQIASALSALLYRIEDAVLTTGLSRSKIYDLISAGELQTVHFGKCVRITADSLHALIQRRADPVKQLPVPRETKPLLDRALTRRASGEPISRCRKSSAPETGQQP
jgi:excisionase family DNA binding protein